MIWTPTGLRQAFVLAFLHIGTRRVFCSPCSFKPDAKWMVGQAHAAIEQAREAGLEMRYLIHDRDGMYVTEFDQVFKDAECRVIRTAPQAPNQNAFIERWVRSIRYECLNHFIVFGKKHFDFLVSRHGDIKMTMRYTHIGLADQAEALKSLPGTTSSSQQIVSTPSQPTSDDVSRHGTAWHKSNKDDDSESSKKASGFDAPWHNESGDGDLCRHPLQSGGGGMDSQLVSLLSL